MKKSSFCLLFGLLVGLIQLSCTKDVENEVLYQLKTTAFTLRTGKTLQLEVGPSTSGWSFSSKNSNIASVSDSGLVTTHYVGRTMLYARNEAGQFVDSVQVTVSPLQTLFQDPYMGFLASEQTVRSIETGDYSTRLTDPHQEGAYFLVYSRESNYTINYHFNASGKLDRSEIDIHPVNAAETDEHLRERYIHLCRKAYTVILHNTNHNYADHHYISPDSSKLICMTYDYVSYAFRVEYRPYTIQAMEAILNDTIQMVYSH